ncbi:pilus assembly protein PilP [Myxococcota bacterium]|nr:pilus assembly protein PilP [Myxococcota bacterium]
MKSIFRWTLFVSLSWTLLGCNDDLRAQFDEEYRPPPMKPIERAKPIAPQTTVKFVYSPVKKRDPFRSHHVSNRENTPTPQTQAASGIPAPTPALLPKRVLTPLERYELDALRVVATITGVANPMAMIEVPDGNRGYIARRGTLVGRNGGRITRIYPDSITVSEIYRDVTGKRIVNLVTLRIRRKEQKIEGSVEIGGRKILLGSDGQTTTDQTATDARSRTKRLFRQSGAGIE